MKFRRCEHSTSHLSDERLRRLFAHDCQVVGPLLTSLPKVESSGGDDGGVAAAGTNAVGMNVGTLAVTPVLAVGPNGTQHILQVNSLFGLN